MAGSQTLVAIIAIIFTGVTYWERSKFSEELERLRREQRKLDDREFLDGEHAQKVRQLAESMFNAHMTVWPVVEATLRDNLGKMADGIIAGHEENRKELERLRYELGLWARCIVACFITVTLVEALVLFIGRGEAAAPLLEWHKHAFGCVVLWFVFGPLWTLITAWRRPAA